MQKLFPVSRFDLVIFDCDGVLIDSERISNRIFAEMLNDLGANVDLEYMFEHFVGQSWAHCREKVSALLGREPPEDFLRTLRSRIVSVFPEELVPMPGVAAVLDSIRHPFCVASNSSLEELRANLGMTGLLPRFGERLFSAKQVARSKPAPDVYLLAASTMGVAPDACLVIEDSTAGVSAAVAAGMEVAGYAAHSPARRLLDAGAHHLFTDMRELPALIGTLEKPA